MKLELEIAPDVEQALKSKAQRLGVPVERYAAGVLRRDVETNGGPYESAQKPAVVEPSYFGAIDAFRTALAASGFTGANGVELVNAGRDARAARILGDGEEPTEEPTEEANGH